MELSLASTIRDQDRPRRWRVALSLLLLLVVVLIYLPSLAYDGCMLDDPNYLLDNERILGGLTADGLRFAFGFEHHSWNPLVFVSYMLEVDLFGHSIAAHRLVNIALHAVNTMLVLAVVRRLTGRWLHGFWVALVFGLHPLQVEAVVWLTARKDTLSTLFGLLALLGYIQYARRGKLSSYLLALLCLAIGLMAKAMLVTLPCVFLLLDFWPFRRLRAIGDTRTDATQEAPPAQSTDEAMTDAASDEPDDGFSVLGVAGRESRWPRLLLEKLPFVAVVAVAIALNTNTQTVIVKTQGLGNSALNSGYAYGHYLAKFFLPTDLAVAYPPVESIARGAKMLPGLVVLALSAVVLWQLRRRPYLFVGWFWWLGTLVPVVGPYRNNPEMYADRFFYLPGIGLMLAVVLLVSELLSSLAKREGAFRRWCAKPALPLSLLGVVLAAMLGVTTLRQMSHWQSDVTNFRRAMAVTDSPGSAVRARYAVALHKAGAEKDLTPLLDDILAVGGDGKGDPAVLRVVADMLEDRDRLDDALAIHQRIVAGFTGKQAVPSLVAMGNLYLKQRRFEQALRAFEQARGQAMNPFGVLSALIECHHQMKQRDKAAEAYQQLKALTPRNADDHLQVGLADVSMGDIDSALRHFRAATERRPNWAEAFNNLGGALAMKRRIQEAHDAFARAVKLMPANARYQANLRRARALLQRRTAAPDPR